MADTLEAVEASKRARADTAPVPAPAPSKPKKRRRINLPESYPKQGFSLGEMPLTLFILLAAAIVYLHLSGKGARVTPSTYRGTLGTDEQINRDMQDLTGLGGTVQNEGPVSVQPPAPSVPLPKFEMAKPHLVPILGDAGIGGSILEP